jgi:hypothetical protein
LFGVAVLAIAVGWFWEPDSVDAKPQDWALQDPRKPVYSTDLDDPFPMPPELVGVNLLAQSAAERDRKSVGCVRCHQNTGDPHAKGTLRIGCTDCHGGDASANEKKTAHVPARYPQFWPTSGNPVRSYTLLNHESPEFVRFVNPGDLRIAHISCGTANCHPQEVQTNRKQIMSTGCMLWGAALYNNGSVPFKKARFGEAYGMNGAGLRLISVPPPTDYEIANHKGVLPYLDPLPRFEVSQPGNVLRFFERGGRFRPEIGIPERLEEPGRPRARLSERGLGTENRTDPVLVSLNKTRLFDPTLNFLGTNDHAGDFRSSGCSACHVVYANDRSQVHSGPYAKDGNRGLATRNMDPTIPKDEPGHPIDHKFTSTIPTSQCIVCHIHPGTTVMNSFLGYMWWDQETEGQLMYPRTQKNPSAEEAINALMRNPEEASVRGNWSDPAFLDDLVSLNPLMDRQQFADFHGHGWVFRAVFKRDREGFLLDHQGKRLPDAKARDLMRAIQVPCQVKKWHQENRFDDAKTAVEAERKLDASHAGTPVHLLDIHLEKGMHCVDCHFSQDEHGNNRLHQEVRAATEIQCIDCHGSATDYTTLRTSGPAAYTSAPDGKGRNLAALRAPKKGGGYVPRFEWETDPAGRARLFQNSMVEPGLRWEVMQTKDTITKGHPRYNAKSDIAKTVHVEGSKMVWGDHPGEEKCAHANKNMSCIACHSSWNPSCYGCHLPQRANVKMPQLHADGEVSRNFTPYNFQTLRDDIYMLARDGDVTGNRINPARSSCAVHVSSYNGNRESIYTLQQTLSADGYAGTAFSTNVPHTVRGTGARETKQCTDCHLSKANDNNAWMAQLLMHGNNYLNLIGKYCWVGAGEEGLYGVVVTEQTEPQAVIGSSLHAVAYPDNFAKHCARHGELEVGHEHPGRDISEGFFKPHQHNEVLNLQLRGEYLYAACGEGGMRAFDVAMIDNKAFAERITTAPVSPVGQRFHVPTRYCTSVAVPSTAAVDPTRKMDPENKEQPIAGYFGYVYLTDKYEGLILVGIGVMVDGHPDNNFLKRDLTFNPDGLLNGAVSCTIVGHYAYVCCDAGLVVISLEKPTEPKVMCVLGEKQHIHHAHVVQCQFRYAYLADEEGIKVLDITDLAHPVPKAQMRIPDVHNLYLARTYAYLAAGPRGLVILDIKEPERPKLAMAYTADGRINDAHDVKLGITYNSEFAYVADGKNGLRVVQLTGPDTPGNDGFSPKPTPRLVATFRIPLHGHALAISKGLDRDRAVDEDGHQIGVFGRVGARPLNAVEQRKMYLRDGKPWYVSDNPSDAIYEERRKAEAGRATVGER